MGGDISGAARALDEAVAVYERKGDVRTAHLCRARLEQLVTKDRTPISDAEDGYRE